MGHETNSFDESTQYPLAPVEETLKGYCMNIGMLNIIPKSFKS